MRVRAVRGLTLSLAGVIAGLALTGCTDPEAAGRVDDTVHESQTPLAAPAKDITKPRRDQRVKKPRRPAQPPVEQAAAGTALAALANLDVKGRAPMTGYDRGAFGQEWLDTNRNGCDTRNDTLSLHLTQLTFDPGTGGCVVLTGVLDDRYTGTRIDFVRGDGFLVDIDHVVALGNAWSGGAARWDIRKRAAFANDPLNLLPADAGENRAKGDGDAATWLPPNKAFRCAYVARQVAVKAKYGLPVTSAEGDAIKRILAACPEQRLPPDSGAPVLATVGVNAPTHPAQPPGKQPQGKPAAASAYYENCDAARAAGAAPVHRGDPGYGSHLDRDGDGTGCE